MRQRSGNRPPSENHALRRRTIGLVVDPDLEARGVVATEERILPAKPVKAGEMEAEIVGRRSVVR